MNLHVNADFCAIPGHTPKLRTKDYEMRVETPLYRHGKDGLYFIVEHKARRTRAGYEARRKGKTATFVNLIDAIDFYNGGQK